MKPIELFKEAVKIVATEAEKGNLICLGYIEVDGMEAVTLVCDDLYHAHNKAELKRIEEKIRKKVQHEQD